MSLLTDDRSDELDPLLRETNSPSARYWNGDEDLDNASLGSNQMIITYKRRWYILFAYTLMAMTQGMVWNTWAPIAASTQTAFSWTDSDNALLTNWGPIAYIVSTVFCAWLMDVKGLRLACCVNSGLVAAGTAVRCISSTPPYVTWFAHLGQLLNGLGGPISMGGPPLISATWFPAGQRTTATGIATGMNGIGIALSFIVGPKLVPDVREVNGTLVIPTKSTGNTSDVQVIRNDIMKYMYIEAGWAAFVLLLLLVYFPAKPPTPPSITSYVERLEFKKGLLQLIRHKKFWILASVYAISVGVYNAWASVIELNLKPLQIPQVTAGWIGFYGTLISCLTSALVGYFADVFSKRMKSFLVTFYTVGTLMFLLFSLVCIQVIPFHIAWLYVTMILGSVAINSACPLYYELACESTYPIAEGITNGMMTWLNNVAALLFFIVLMAPLGTAWMNWVNVACVAVCIPVLFTFSDKYTRLDIDTTTPEDGKTNNRINT